MIVLGVNAVFHDPAAALVDRRRDRRRGRGGALLAAQARQVARRRSRPGSCPSRRWRWCLERGRRRAGRARRRRLLLRPRARVQPDGDITAAEWEGLRTLYARRAPAVPRRARCPGSTRARALGRPPRRPRRVGDLRLAASTRAACSCSTGAASAAPTSPGRYVGRRARGARRPGAAALARPALRGADRAPRLPPLLRRVQGDGDGVLRGARVPRRASARARPRRRATAASSSAPSTSARSRPPLAPGGDVHAGARGAGRRPCRRGSRRSCSISPAGCTSSTGDRDLVMAGGVALNCVANSRLLARGPVRAGLGAAGRGRLGHGARRGAARRARARRRRARRWRSAALGPRLGRRCAGRAAGDRRGRLRAARRRRRRRRRGARRQPGRRLVPGRGRSSARARSATARCSPTRASRRTSRS